MWRSCRMGLFNAIAVGILVFAAPQAQAAADAGQVVGVAGQAAIVSGGQRAAAKLGDALHVGDTVEVSANSKLKMRMVDGSVISAAAGTQMTIQSYSASGGQRQDAAVALASGLLRSVVSSTSQPARFEVDTATGTAVTRSTDWFIEVQQGNSMQVGVLTGTVAMTSRQTSRSVTIPAGWGARLEAGRDPVPARVWTPAEFSAVITRTDVP